MSGASSVAVRPSRRSIEVSATIAPQPSPSGRRWLVTRTVFAEAMQRAAASSGSLVIPALLFLLRLGSRLLPLLLVLADDLRDLHPEGEPGVAHEPQLGRSHQAQAPAHRPAQEPGRAAEPFDGLVRH